jgi:hypothetical protein
VADAAITRVRRATRELLVVDIWLPTQEHFVDASGRVISNNVRIISLVKHTRMSGSCGSNATWTEVRISSGDPKNVSPATVRSVYVSPLVSVTGTLSRSIDSSVPSAGLKPSSGQYRNSCEKPTLKQASPRSDTLPAGVPAA